MGEEWMRERVLRGRTLRACEVTQPNKILDKKDIFAVRGEIKNIIVLGFLVTENASDSEAWISSASLKKKEVVISFTSSGKNMTTPSGPLMET